MTETIRVGLDAWIIQDGNYGDFLQGRTYAFALEFWPTKPLVVRHPNAIDAPVSTSWLHGSTYAVKGKVSFVGAGWWVLDVGIPMYLDHQDPPGPRGAPVRGEIYIGIDHFAYFEAHSRQPDAPALIHDWRIEAIELDTAPWVETRPRHFERDRSRQGWESVRQTEAWSDGGRSAYVLTCSRLSDEPRNHR